MDGGFPFLMQEKPGLRDQVRLVWPCPFELRGNPHPLPLNPDIWSLSACFRQIFTQEIPFNWFRSKKMEEREGRGKCLFF